MKKIKWMVIAILVGTLFPIFGKTVEKPNILLIIADDLGPQLGCYGDVTAKTPYIDRLAATGVRFNQAHVTAASCSPSRGSIFTGLYPHQHGMVALSQQGWGRMHDDVPKLPNALKQLGYRTAIIGKTHFEPFDQFEFDYVETDTKKVIFERDVRWMNRKAEGWLDRESESDPFFLVMSYVDPHRGGGDGRYEQGKNEKFPRIRHGLPEHPPSADETVPVPFLGVDSPNVRMENSDYYSCVQRLDTGVGELLEMMESKQLLENTLIVFIGDHGPDLTRGKISAYASATHIPMLIKWPGHTDAGLVRDELVSTIDLFPTFITAVGGTISDSRQTGCSLQSLLEKGEAEWRSSLGTEFISHVPWHYYPRYTILDGKYHFVHNLHSDRENPLEGHNYCYAWWEVQKPSYDGTKIRTVYDHVERPPEFELFNLEEDPFEHENLADNPEYKELVQKLSRKVDAWRRQTKDPFLDPGHAEAYVREVAEMKTAWEIRNGIRKASVQPKPAFFAVKVGKIKRPDLFAGGISNHWNFPNHHSGFAAPGGGVQARMNQNGLCMNRPISEAGISTGTAVVSATFIQGENSALYDISWNIGFSTGHSKYMQNMGGDTVCVRFLTAGPHKGRFQWAVYREGTRVGKSYAPHKTADWNPDDEIRLTLSYDLTSGEAIATAENLAEGTLISSTHATYPGIAGFKYAGVDMTGFPSGDAGLSAVVKTFSFQASEL